MSIKLESSAVFGLNSLYQTIYVSEMKVRHLNPDMQAIVQDILRTSVRNNAAANVTGALLCCGSNFLQVLEGRRIDIGATLERIKGDARHNSIKVIANAPVAERRFARWSMCAGILSSTDKAIVDVLASSGKFDAFRLSAEAAMKLLLAVGRLQKGA